MSDTARPRPPWLGPTPFNSYWEYGDGLRVADAWESIPWQDRRLSLYDVHTNALRGSRKDLRAMRQFYINLTTERLKS